MSEKDTALAVPEQTQIIRSQPTRTMQETRQEVFVPRNLTEALGLAKMMAKSEMVPKEYRGKAENILIAMQMGAELGVAPMQALTNIAVINGRPAVWGDLALGLVQRHPDYEWHKEYFEGSGDDFAAVFEIKRKGSPVHKSKFSVIDAKTAKLWGKRGYSGADTPWITSPKRMLTMRARGFGIRDQFADALKGLKLAEEAMDIPPDMAPARAEIPATGFAAISESTEPNRGHGQEGMLIQGQPPAPPAAASPAEDQTPKKQEDWICNECRATNGHLPSCSKHAAWRESLKTAGKPVSSAATPQIEAQTTPSTPDSPKAFKTIPCKVVSVKTRTKKPLRVLDVLTDEGEWQMSVWHEHLHPILDEEATGALCVFEVSEKTVRDRTYTNLEHILEIAGQKYADDKPVIVQEGELTAEQLGFPKTDVDEAEIPE